MKFDKQFYLSNFFKLERYRVFAEKFAEGDPEINEAAVKILVPAKNIPAKFPDKFFAWEQPQNKRYRALTATSGGQGTVDALDNALRLLLEPLYPFLKDIRLIRYVVTNTMERSVGTGAEVEVFILSTNADGRLYYSETRSRSVIEASFLSLANIYNRYFRDDFVAGQDSAKASSTSKSARTKKKNA